MEQGSRRRRATTPPRLLGESAPEAIRPMGQQQQRGSVYAPAAVARAARAAGRASGGLEGQVHVPVLDAGVQVDGAADPVAQALVEGDGVQLR